MTGRGYKKVSDKFLLDSYERTKNVWKTASEAGMCGQSVHIRLKRLGVDMSINKFSEEDFEFLKLNYELYVSSGKLTELAEKMGRTRNFICRKARELGLTDLKRKSTDETKMKSSESKKKWHIENEHPKGMLGKKHSSDTLSVLSKKSKKFWASIPADKMSEISARAMATKIKKYGNCANSNRGNCSWMSGWREIGGKRKYFRSRWEANYARYLEFLKTSGEIVDWLHEEDSFMLFDDVNKKHFSFLPDFKVFYRGRHEYHEVKGWMDDRSKTKIRLMAECHPNETLVVIDSKWFSEHAKGIGLLIGDWEDMSKKR